MITCLAIDPGRNAAIAIGEADPATGQMKVERKHQPIESLKTMPNCRSCKHYATSSLPDYAMFCKLLDIHRDVTESCDKWEIHQ